MRHMSIAEFIHLKLSRVLTGGLAVSACQGKAWQRAIWITTQGQPIKAIASWLPYI